LRQGWYLKERTKEKPILLRKTNKTNSQTLKTSQKTPKSTPKIKAPALSFLKLTTIGGKPFKNCLK
jgi:hypothetical protein